VNSHFLDELLHLITPIPIELGRLRGKKVCEKDTYHDGYVHVLHSAES
jgi:hypothetical protein